jgi:hypothetical protein
MKNYLIKSVVMMFIIMSVTMSYSQAEQTSAQAIEEILGVVEHRDELTRLNSGITTLLADQRLTDQAARQMLQQSQTVLNEMLNQKTGANADNLIDLAKWLHAQGEEKLAIRDAGGIPTPQQQFVLDNSLAGEETYLASLLNGILRYYLEIDRQTAGGAKLEALLQLYLNFRSVLELSWRLVDDFLLYAPQWTQTRFPQLTADQKRQFLGDVNDARAEKAAGPTADEEPAPLPTPQEQAAYEAAYQFIVNNTPQQP